MNIQQWTALAVFMIREVEDVEEQLSQLARRDPTLDPRRVGPGVDFRGLFPRKRERSA